MMFLLIEQDDINMMNKAMSCDSQTNADTGKSMVR